MKKNLYLVTLFLIIALNSYSQENLEKLLWDSVKLSKEPTEDDYDSYILNGKIEDIKSGYLKVFGDWDSSCCGFSMVVAAFKAKNNKYITLIRNEEELCNFIYKIESNKSIYNLFPKELNLSVFIPKGDFSFFYFDIDPPRKGTDVLVNLNPTPFGIKNFSKDPYNYSTNRTIEDFSFFRSFVEKIKDNNDLKFLIEKNYKTIKKETMNLIAEEIKRKKRDIPEYNLETISLKASKLYKIYKDFESRKYDAFVLGWSRDLGKFYVKKKIKKQKPMSFINFLKKYRFWAAIC